MILGIGTDIVEIKHFKGASKKSPKVLERLFTPKELEKANKLSGNKKFAYYSKRFAGKEALSKACGTGIGADIGWHDMEILNDKKGAPTVKFSGKAQKFLQKKFKVKKVTPFISLTDETEYAMAFAVLVK